MKDFFKGFAGKVLAGVALVLVGIMIYAASTGGFATIPATIVGAIVNPLQAAASGIADGVNNFFGAFTNTRDLQTQNEALQEELNKLRKQQVELDELRRKNDMLREYLDLKEQHPDYKFVDARVQAVDASDKSGNFVIGKGSKDGVKKNDPVITPAGLVGVVYEVDIASAKVRTILDSSVQVSAYVSSTDEDCITNGSIQLAQQGLLRVNMLPRETGAVEGNIVATRGKSGVYPYGLLIGEIQEVHPESNGLSVYAIVKPFVDIKSVTSVFVITAFNE